MNLNIGNPNLKMGKSYAFSCDFQIRDIIQLNFRYKVTTNPILSSRRYFETNTILPEYSDYEALAGAVLITPINAKNYNSFDISATSYSKRGAILVRGELNHTFENPEVDLLGKIVRSYTHQTNSNLLLLSNFSHTFRLDITNQTAYKYSNIKTHNLLNPSESGGGIAPKARI